MDLITKNIFQQHNIFKNLSDDIVGEILSYYGSIKERNGKYMKQIPKTDIRYEMLHNLHNIKEIYIVADNRFEMIIKFSKNSIFHLLITKNRYGYIDYHFLRNYSFTGSMYTRK